MISLNSHKQFSIIFLIITLAISAMNCISAEEETRWHCRSDDRWDVSAVVDKITGDFAFTLSNVSPSDERILIAREVWLLNFSYEIIEKKALSDLVLIPRTSGFSHQTSFSINFSDKYFHRASNVSINNVHSILLFVDHTEMTLVSATGAAKAKEDRCFVLAKISSASSSTIIK